MVEGPGGVQGFYLGICKWQVGNFTLEFKATFSFGFSGLRGSDEIFNCKDAGIFGFSYCNFKVCECKFSVYHKRDKLSPLGRPGGI
jgi:hypothetical protein